MRTTVITTQTRARKSGKRLAVTLRLAVWPIRNDEDYDRAMKVIEKLVLRDDLTAAEEARLEIFSVLIEAYDQEHYPIDTSHITPIDMLKSLMGDHGMNASDLGRLLGNRSLGSLILNGKRQLSKAHIKKLCARFAMKPEAFL